MEVVMTVIYYFDDVVLSHDDKFSVKTQFIPEYQDLLKKGTNRNEHEEKLFKSYFVHMAIYDHKKKDIITLYFGMFNEIAYELFDQTRNIEIKNEIIRQCSWLN